MEVKVGAGWLSSVSQLTAAVSSLVAAVSFVPIAVRLVMVAGGCWGVGGGHVDVDAEQRLCTIFVVGTI